jgi:hypothetical protein
MSAIFTWKKGAENYFQPIWEKNFNFCLLCLFRYVKHLLNTLYKPKHNKTMKNFMLLFRGGSDAMQMSPEESQQHMQKWFAWVEELQQKGIYTSGEALIPGGKMVSQGGVVTDGPFAESKEIVGGFFIVKANNLEEAAEIAKGCPDLPLNGTVEVRDVVVFEGM